MIRSPRKARASKVAAAATAIAALLTVTFLLPTSSPAQDGGAPAASGSDQSALIARGFDVWLNEGGCFNCHGLFGEGGEGGHFPAGPSLRRTRLNEEALWQTVACGRPGTQMPYNMAGAYTEVSCYGQPVGTDPTTLRVVPGVDMPQEDIDALVAFIFADIVGKGRVTREECALYHGGNADDPDCNWR